LTEQVHVFAGDPLDRADHKRRDEAWIEAKLVDPATRFLTFNKLKVFADRGPPTKLVWLGSEILSLTNSAQPVFLGVLDEVAHFALDVTDCADEVTALGSASDGHFEDPRATATHASTEDTGILAHAKSLVDWHARHGFCAKCGSATTAHFGAKERHCDSCGASHYPRTDPVVIMLVHDGDRCLLGRSRRRVTKLYSALAGFVDQGESIEEAVRREIYEESGVKVGTVRYHSSQPWPFPASLMIGCMAEALSTDIVIDEHELADVRWFDRAHVKKVLEAKDEVDEDLQLPGPIAIAHHLIKAWVAET
jgi:NAD+ diphosphatase